MGRVRGTRRRWSPAVLPVSPTVVADALAGAGLSSDYRELVEVAAGQHRRRLIGGDPVVVLDVAVDEPGRRRNRQEVAGRRWAHEAGVHVPEVLAADQAGGWLLGRYAQPIGVVNEGLLLEAVQVARLIADGPALSGLSGRTWRASRRSAPVRAVQLVRARLPVRAFVGARAAAAALPRDAIAHGDFHLGNLLTAGGRLACVDWEFLGPAPVGTDLLRLWATLEDPQLRDLVRELLFSQVPSAGHPNLAVLARWIAIRSLAEAASEPDGFERARALRRARQVRASSLLANGWPGSV